MAEEARIVTLGCRLNTFESEVMRGHARAAGLTDAVIVNTCAVTAEAERQARQTIRRLRRENPNARIIVTGCAAQIHPERFAAMAEVDRVLGNLEKMRPDGLAGDARVAVSDIMAARTMAPHPIGDFGGRARAVIEVQQGCDHRCTFCIIPFGRGPGRSTPVAEVIAQGRRLAERGFSEITLSGVDLTSYGLDLGGITLGALARGLLDAVPEIVRLRFSSLDPAAIDEDMFALYADEPRVMPHAHLSIQAGDDTVLKRMKRRHDRARALAVCARLASIRPGIALGADLIAGFPTEDGAMFDNTRRLIDEAGLVHLHVFPYSAREGTPAARMPMVPATVRKERAAALRALGEEALSRFAAARVGQTAAVLVERDDGTGLSEHFLAARTAGSGRPGSMVSGRVTAFKDGLLLIEDL